MNINNETKEKMLNIVIEELTSLQPFTALRFYTVDRSTLTATLGTVLTYFIILYQTVTCTDPIASPNQEILNSTKV